jgi:hypothetical protein
MEHRSSENHRLKAVALVTGCKPCSGQRPAKTCRFCVGLCIPNSYDSPRAGGALLLAMMRGRTAWKPDASVVQRTFVLPNQMEKTDGRPFAPARIV